MLNKTTAEKARRAELCRQLIGPGKEIMWQRSIPKWARDIILETAERHQVPLTLILTACTKRAVVAARNEIVYRMKEERPDISCSRMEDWLAKDHTTLFNCIYRHAEQNGLPNLTGFGVNNKRHRRAV